MARETGLEPAASAVTGRRSNQLSYSRNPNRRLSFAHAIARPSEYVKLPPASSCEIGVPAAFPPIAAPRDTVP
jgi:hypothetical protein